jgi:hypothetical protein
MKKTYMETRKAVKALVIAHGVNGISGNHINALIDDGHNGTNIQNAINYFQFSPSTAKYR